MLLNSVSIIDKVINGGENIQVVFNDPIIKDLLKNPGKAGLSTDDLEGKTDQQKTEMIVGEYFAKIAANAGKLASRLLFHAQWGYATPDWFDHRHHILDPEKHFNDYWCESADNVLRVLPLHGKLLNLCAGDGFYDYYFYRKRAKEIVCIDINPEQYRQALRLHKAENITYLLENTLTCELDEAMYDVVTIRGAIEHFSQEDQQAIFERSRAALKMGGWFCGDTPANPAKERGVQLPAHENEWADEGEMRRELEKVFSHIETHTMISSDRTTLFWRCRKDESMIQTESIAIEKTGAKSNEVQLDESKRGISERGSDTGKDCFEVSVVSGSNDRKGIHKINGGREEERFQVKCVSK